MTIIIWCDGLNKMIYRVQIITLIQIVNMRTNVSEVTIGWLMKRQAVSTEHNAWWAGIGLDSVSTREKVYFYVTITSFCEFSYGNLGD